MTSLRRLLPRAFTPFFHRFPRPTPVQVAGIPPILAGRDVLLCAPTAAGKTEAYAAPLVERLLGGNRGPGRVLLVSPTRALANDLKRRLEGPMHQAGVGLGRYTGEHKERSGGRLAEVVVATPEAWDSLLARRPGELAELAAVVLDEVHILDGTPRGDQVRILLHRLGKPGCQRIGASATVDRPGEVAARYGLGGEVVVAGLDQSLRVKMFRGRRPRDVARHLGELARAGVRKVLVFANARNRVEEYAAAMVGATPFGGQVFAHHGSLARAARERTERLFWNAPAAVCFATLTLELGIDIGSVDYVLLLDPPPDPASLRQRAGRGARRAEQGRVGCVCGGKGQEAVYRVLLRLAARGELCRGPYAFRPGVLVQQALVLAGAEGWVGAERLEAIVPAAVARELPAGWAEDVLDETARQGLFERAGAGRFVLAESWEARYRRGTVHSNISAARQIAVIDRLTGDELGGVRPGEEGEAGDLSLGGRSRRLARAEADRLLTDAGRRSMPARFASQPPPVMGLRLARALAKELGAGERELVQCRVEGAWLLLHGTGTVGGMLLAAWWREHSGVGAAGAGPLLLRVGKRLEERPVPGGKLVDQVLGKEAGPLAGQLAMGPHHRRLPREMGRRALRAAAGVEEVVRFLAEAKLVEGEGADAAAWQQLE